MGLEGLSLEKGAGQRWNLGERKLQTQTQTLVIKCSPKGCRSGNEKENEPNHHRRHASDRWKPSVRDAAKRMLILGKVGVGRLVTSYSKNMLNQM